MKKSNLVFTEKNTGKIISGVITYESGAGETDCEWCPIRDQFRDNDICICSILDESLYTMPQVDGVPFNNFGDFFCDKVNIIAFNGITVDGIDHDKLDNFTIKYSLNDLLEKVCPGRCILLNNPQDCTKEHRKCPGCILGELEEGD